MKRVPVEVREDHLERLARSGRPTMAIAELVWNSLDADALTVDVEVSRSLLGAIEKITISDDGHGIQEGEAESAFGNLGGSWKRNQDRTRTRHRLLHGREGKGRFRAFALGERVTWTTRSDSATSLQQLVIRGSWPNLEYFEVAESTTAPDGFSAGTEVLIESISQDLPDITAPRYAEELGEIFAIYLTQYPQVQINYCGTPLDPEPFKRRVTDYPLGPMEVDDRSVEDAELTVIEWASPKTRSLYLCDQDGFTFGKVSPGIHAPGFNFTAYVRSTVIRDLAEQGLLELGEMDPMVSTMVNAAKTKLRAHFSQRLAEAAKSLVHDWKQERSYPYEGEARNAVEKAERQVFEVVAYNVASYVPSIAEGDRASRQLSFRLIRQALEENPRALRKILHEVVGLPKEAQDDLAALLERTTLTAVIEAAKEAADRLDFLAGLELLVFRPESKEELLERSELHRILAGETWVFGEEFNLSVDDRSLSEVLRAHIETIRRDSPETLADNLDLDTPVLRADGRAAIVDLMLSRRIPQPRSRLREHLVVELKRPAQTLNLAVTHQLRSYAYAVQRDERFARTDTKWVFWAVSNRITDEARWNMQDRDSGILFADPDGRSVIHLRTWGEILEESRSRLTFFQDRLNYAFDDESALAYLRRTHAKYLPDVLSLDTQGATSPKVPAPTESNGT